MKNEIKILLRPLTEFILFEINPYIYITVILVFLIFIMILAILMILILLLRNKQLFSKLVWKFIISFIYINGEKDKNSYEQTQQDQEPRQEYDA